MTRTRRTPAQIAADMAQKAQEAAVRAKLSDAATNPALLPLLGALKQAQSKLNKAKRDTADTNPNSFQHRRAAFQLRLTEIDAAEALCLAAREDAARLVAAIKSDIEDLSESIAAGDDVTDIAASLAYGYTLPDRQALREAAEITHRARKEYKAGILADDVPDVTETPAEMEISAES